MSDNKIKIHRKEIPTRKRKNPGVFVSITSLVFLALAVALTIAALSGKFGFASATEIISEGNRQIIRVPPGGNLQAAIEKARGGDIIELQAGATYYGEIILPDTPITDYITFQSSRAKELPENQRVNPAQANLMAKIVTRGKGTPSVSTAAGAHHFRFVGIEFAPSNSDYIYNLVFFGEPRKLSDAAHHLEIDRCYLHSLASGVTRRGVALNSADTVIKNSYLSGFAGNRQETQAIAGWTGTRNVKIINNYLEGGAENLLFGGADPASADLIPADIEVRGNYFFKPAEWKNKNTMKNLFELKNAKRVQLVGNYFESSWAGSALTITVRNQDGEAPFSAIEDVLIKDNVVVNAAEGINILGKDDIFPSQTLKRLTIVNNLLLDIGNKTESGAGYFIQVSDGEDILIANNTVFNFGNTVTFYGEMPKNILIRDNIVNHNNYGIHGYADIKSAAGQKVFQNNVIVNNKRIDLYDSSFPPNNFWVQDYKDIGFMNFAQNDFRLAPNSRFKGKGKNGSDIGSSLNANELKKLVVR